DRMPFAVAYHIITALFLAFILITLMRKFYRERSVSADAVYASFCGYLLLGLVFGHIYSMVECMIPGSFYGDHAIGEKFEAEWHRQFLLIYFSFITLTTVGYGDMKPMGDLARGLVVIEAISGQFYIAVLVAELIGRRVGQRSLHDPGNHGKPGS